MTSKLPVLCESCARWRFDLTCSSFPDGIPELIIVYGDDHRESLQGEPPFELDPARRSLFDRWERYRPV